MELDHILDKVYTVSNASKKQLRAIVKEVSLPKGTHLISSAKTEPNIYLLKNGLVRAYSDTENREITFWFGTQGDTVLSMNGYVNNKISYEDIELLENCDLYVIKTSELKTLYKTNIEIANWGRKMIELELVKAEERLISLQCKTAKERYLDLIFNHPNLIQRVALMHIASYLGITQVSLSRIRADI